MATITPVLRKDKINSKGQCPVNIRITDSKTNKYVSIGMSLRESQWNDRQGRARKGHSKTELVNTKIAEYLAKAEAEILRITIAGAPVTAQRIKSALASTKPEQQEHDFHSYADEVIVDLKRRRQLYTERRYRSIMVKLKAFTGPHLAFTDLTPQLLHEFETHLIGHYKNKPETVASNLRAIRAVVNRAIKDGHMSKADYPFFHFKIRRGKSNRTKLSWEEIEAIENACLIPDSLEWHARNYFLFSFYCAGIRFGDVAKLRHRNIREGRLSYTMSKTGTAKSIKLPPKAMAILAPYGIGQEPDDAFLFPILKRYDLSTPEKLLNAISTQNALINKYLKRIAEVARVRQKLSFHISRHSFADLARQKGWDVYEISTALGHASPTVTMTYIRSLESEALDEKMDAFFADT